MKCINMAAVLYAFAVLAQVQGRTFVVRPGESVDAALKAVRCVGGTTNKIVLATGDHYLSEPLLLTDADSGLTICAAAVGKAILYGGHPVTNWVRDADTPFWTASLPGVKEGVRDFRCLLVDGRVAERARFPGGTNRLHVVGGWNLPLTSGVMGVWPRQPRYDELVTLRYNPNELPKTIDFHNAEILHYHIWRASYSSVASNDTSRSELYFSSPGDWPVGACGRKEYEVFNVREGMKKPGMWYLDRTAGKVVYWPESGQDMRKIRVIAPMTECAIRIAGEKARPVRNVTIDGIAIRAVSAPPRSITRTSAAIDVRDAIGLRLTRLAIDAVAGMAVRASGGHGGTLACCSIHETGADAVQWFVADSTIVSNHVWSSGRIFPAATGLYIGGHGIVVRGNLVHDTPYCGIKMYGSGFVIEDNEVHHAMQTLRDGAAFYSTSIWHSTIRRNVVHDLPLGTKGFCAIAFYADERSSDVLYEENVAYGSDIPIHCHLAANVTLRGNTFVSPTSLALSFQNSRNAVVEGNTLAAGTTFEVRQPEAVSSWNGNRVYRRVVHGGPVVLDTVFRPIPLVQPRAKPVIATFMEREPTLDGNAGPDEWPVAATLLRLDAKRHLVTGLPISLRVSWNEKNLHVTARVGNWNARFSDGMSWGKDDGFELNVNGKIVHIFACGGIETHDKALREALRLFVGPEPGKKLSDWSYPLILEATVPFDILGIKPNDGFSIPFNVAYHSSKLDLTAFLDSPKNTSPIPTGTLILKRQRKETRP